LQAVYEEKRFVKGGGYYCGGRGLKKITRKKNAQKKGRICTKVTLWVKEKKKFHQGSWEEKKEGSRTKKPARERGTQMQQNRFPSEEKKGGGGNS